MANIVEFPKQDRKHFMGAVFGFSGLYAEAWLLASPQPIVWPALMLGLPLIWLSVVDIDRFEIPDLASAWILLGGIWWHYGYGWGVMMDVLLVFLLVFLFSILAEKWLQKTALGFGDVKLLAASAAWVGALGISSVALLASVAGVVFTVMMWGIKRRRFDAPIPFGPFIAMGVWAVWLFGPIL
ncbi:MAG: prepilin peptidase [Rhodobacteraceae bacterium]|nr:prepilin peptidase [Paracoccaceae bacterium]